MVPYQPFHVVEACFKQIYRLGRKQSTNEFLIRQSIDSNVFTKYRTSNQMEFGLRATGSVFSVSMLVLSDDSRFLVSSVWSDFVVWFVGCRFFLTMHVDSFSVV